MMKQTGTQPGSNQLNLLESTEKNLNKSLFFKLGRHLYRFATDIRYRHAKGFVPIPKNFSTKIAPWIAVKMAWLAYPLMMLMDRFGYRFLATGHSDSPGHVFVELDYFFRLKKKGNVSTSNRWLIIWPDSEVARGAKKHYSKKIEFFIVSNVAFMLFLPLWLRYPDMLVDVALSYCLFKIPRLPSTPVARFFSTVDYPQLWNRLAAYNRLRLETGTNTDMVPIRGSLNSLLQSLGAISDQYYAVVQISTSVRNATGAIFDPSTYIPALHYMKSKGMQLIFAGREVMPKLFQDIGVINYAQSRYASFYNDVILLYYAEIALTSGSGVSNLVDIFDKKLVVVNTWHLPIGPVGARTIVVPSLLVRQNGSSCLTSGEQIRYFYENNAQIGDGRVCSAKADEILAAVKEVEELDGAASPRSSLQVSFYDNHMECPMAYGNSRFSQYFLENHPKWYQNMTNRL